MLAKEIWHHHDNYNCHEKSLICDGKKSDIQLVAKSKSTKLQHLNFNNELGVHMYSMTCLHGILVHSLSPPSMRR